MSERELKAIETAWVNNQFGTHWEGCHMVNRHHGCAIARLLSEVRRLQSEVAAAALKEISNTGEWQSLIEWATLNGHHEVLDYLKRR